MIIELDIIPKGLQLNKWYKVKELNGLHVTTIYVEFKFAWDANGNRTTVPQYGQPGYLEMNYNGTGYP